MGSLRPWFASCWGNHRLVRTVGLVTVSRVGSAPSEGSLVVWVVPVSANGFFKGGVLAGLLQEVGLRSSVCVSVLATASGVGIGSAICAAASRIVVELVRAGAIEVSVVAGDHFARRWRSAVSVITLKGFIIYRICVTTCPTRAPALDANRVVVGILAIIFTSP